MAITPQAAKGLTESEHAQVVRLEREIDDFLAKTEGRSTGTFPCFEFKPDVPNRAVVAELIVRYQRAGWKKVELNTGRDGTFLQFVAPGQWTKEDDSPAKADQVKKLVAKWSQELDLRDEGVAARKTWKKIKEIASPNMLVKILEDKFLGLH